MNVGAYLDRIGYAGAAEPTHAVLAAFLDIALGRRLVLDRRANYAKSSSGDGAAGASS